MNSPSPPPQAAPFPVRSRGRSRGWWLRQLHQWHWISSATSLVCLLFFVLSGVTLNHAADIAGSAETVQKTAQLGAAGLKPLQARIAEGAKLPLPAAVTDDLAKSLERPLPDRPAEWSAESVDLDLSRPGAEGTLSIDRATGAVDYELTSHGWIAWANDLHKGRNAGSAWFWFIDLFAVACLVFALTGLVLLYLHARHRPSTWPLVGFGLLLPVILLILFVHA